MVSFSAAASSAYGAVVGDGIADLGRRLGPCHPTLRSAIAGNARGGIAIAISRIGILRNPIAAED
jgi:hypothetical protein